MGGIVTPADVEREIQRLMAERGIDRVEAILIVGNRSTEVFGHGDLVCLHPLSAEQRRQLGLGRDPEEVMAEQRARQAREAELLGAATDGRDQPARRPTAVGRRRRTPR